MLDITGCEGLFGNERELLARVEKDIGSLGFSVQVAIAPTPWSARAMARLNPYTVIQSQDLPQALYQLPLEALELDLRVHQTLQELGIKRLLELFRLPRAQLLARFGATLIDRIDEIRGDKRDPRLFESEERDWHIEETLCDTVRDSAYLYEIIFDILKRLCLMLSQEGLGLLKLELLFRHYDHKKSCVHISLVRPSSDADKIFRLLKLKLDNWDAGLGIENITLRAKHAKRLALQKISLSYEDSPSDADLTTLLDTLLNRIGDKNVFQFTANESHIPEKSFKVTNVMPTQAGIHTATPQLDTSLRSQDNLARPTRLLKIPEPIEVIALLPDSPPRRIIWRKRFVFHVIKADGPERIESEWWLSNSGDARDYYRIEDKRGLRLWVFKQVTQKHPVPNWYLHGLLA